MGLPMGELDSAVGIRVREVRDTVRTRMHCANLSSCCCSLVGTGAGVRSGARTLARVLRALYAGDRGWMSLSGVIGLSGKFGARFARIRWSN
jgi:hypothetical protein